MNKEGYISNFMLKDPNVGSLEWESVLWKDPNTKDPNMKDPNTNNVLRGEARDARGFLKLSSIVKFTLEEDGTPGIWVYYDKDNLKETAQLVERPKDGSSHDWMAGADLNSKCNMVMYFPAREDPTPADVNGPLEDGGLQDMCHSWRGLTKFGSVSFYYEFAMNMKWTGKQNLVKTNMKKQLLPWNQMPYDELWIMYEHFNGNKVQQYTKI